ncbi:Na+/H+ antiporter NhaA [Dickeya dianthicola]|uniref:Na+/H+ antiporter NhaA n=1 Tax=Dickeya dianthicola TaxID=204039 RepID=UPI0003A3E68F|nr:Na+/H+ antiporter NhaA type [Dickeya dianthicola RNS04.9]MBT1429584.1 Na+/H+ antiporter NhaA [Dickeya dianthicola]MBT1433610.1 Na+/H+ antiporter NhaA [Dickeya dianthicola]MBT1461100.1 Na+/H+ antiporter NhaA [Dickeya dianthicola]MBT1490295.1 Na+/H+ antiporter NhaA [Dickeya dianthicola]
MIKLFRYLIGLEAAAGMILIAATLLALLVANIPATLPWYQSFLEIPVVMGIGSLEINKPLLLWINDGLMALFFLQVGLEVKRELVVGALASRRQAILPVVAAFGGMLVPALFFLLFNAAEVETRSGWAIPTATDIAFAVGILVLLGKRVPGGLKVFLLALAIIDDLGAIVIIALFYTQQLHWVALSGALAMIAVLAYMNHQQVMKTSAYLLVGIVLWVCILKSGVHATLAGVIVGFFIPLRAPAGSPSPGSTLEHGLASWIALLVIPLFAFANAGITLQGVAVGHLLSPLTLGIASGLLLGKPIGVSLFSWLVIRLGLGSLPGGVDFRQVMAVSVLCGIGFTMSIFITLLAFGEVSAQDILYAKLAILLTSITTAVLGYLTLRSVLPGAQR